MSLPLVTGDEVTWLLVEQMREVDQIMVEELGISLVRIMENAGRNLAELARHLLGGGTARQAIAVLVGPGANGGGGLVAARHLDRGGRTCRGRTRHRRGPRVSRRRPLRSRSNSASGTRARRRDTDPRCGYQVLVEVR